MIPEINALLDDYWVWLRQETSLREINDVVELTTPYLDRHNDYFQIYIKRDQSGYVLTDDGYILDDLEQSGCRMDSPKRQGLLRTIINGFGVSLDTDALEVQVSADNFALRKHNLVQAMLAVNDLFYLAAPRIASLFYEDVVGWLDLCEIRYTPSIKLTGKSGYDHQFDFVIPKSKVKPERVLRTLNRPNRNNAQAMVFSWLDTKDVRSPDTLAYAILNDEEKTVSGSVMDAMCNYGIRPLPWSDREQARQDLAA